MLDKIRLLVQELSQGVKIFHLNKIWDSHYKKVVTVQNSYKEAKVQLYVVK